MARIPSAGCSTFEESRSRDESQEYAIDLSLSNCSPQLYQLQKFFYLEWLVCVLFTCTFTLVCTVFPRLFYFFITMV